MAFERQAAKAAASNKEHGYPELDLALKSAEDHQLAFKKVNYLHEEEMNRLNLGAIGCLFGDGKSVPTIAALLTVGLSFFVAIGLDIAMYMKRDNAEIFSTNAERSISVALSALAYVFGKGGK